MERSQRTRKDFYLQGKSTAVVIGAASGVKHPTPTPAQHHPPAFPLRKGTQNSPPAQTVRPIRRFTCKLPPGDPPGRPAPMRGGPPSPPRDAPPPAPGGSDAGGGAVPGQRGVGDSGGSGAGRWQRRIPASPQRSALRSAARSRVRGGGWGGRLRPEQREEEEEEVEEKEEEGCALKLAALFFSRVSLWCAPPPLPPTPVPQKLSPGCSFGGSPPCKRLFHPGAPQNSTQRDGKGFGCLIPKGLAVIDPERLHGAAPVVFPFILSHRPPLNGEVWKSSIPRATCTYAHARKIEPPWKI